MKIQTIYLLVGLPGSGKSTYAKLLCKKQTIVYSSDKIRKEITGDVNNQLFNMKVFDILKKRTIESLLNGNSVIIDSTNLSYKRRKNFIESLNKIECNKIAIVMATPFNECIKRDSERERSVGKNVLDRMYKSFSMPSKMEGFDKIDIAYADCEYNNYKASDMIDKVIFLKNINQCNSNHSLTIGSHCEKTWENLLGTDCDMRICYAGLLHDIGKQYTMSFQNFKGEYSNQAHFYRHENVSTYEAMFYLKGNGFDINSIIYICNLIQYHMRPHLLTTEKSINKLKRFLGEDFYNDLMLLHEADKNAR